MYHHFSVILKAVSFILQESFTNTHKYTTKFFILCHVFLLDLTVAKECMKAIENRKEYIFLKFVIWMLDKQNKKSHLKEKKFLQQKKKNNRIV